VKTPVVYLVFFILSLFWSALARAQFIDFNVLSFSDTFTTSGTSKISRSIYDVGLGTLMGKSDNWILGLSFGSSSFTDQSTTTITYVASDFGLKIGLFWTKQKSWFSTLTYNFQSTAKYNDSTTATELRGTSIKADVGYAFWPSDSLGVAIKVFYYAPSFKESVASGTLTSISYTRALVYPSFSVMISY